MKRTKCESCGADVIHIVDQDGTAQIVNKTRARMYGLDPQRYLVHLNKPYLAHISHFLTCPNANQHSKKTRR